MQYSKKHRKHIEEVASETLDTFGAIADAAREALATGSGASEAVLANANTATTEKAIQNLKAIAAASRQGHEWLVSEPAIARVTVLDDAGQEATYYICRATPVSGVDLLASYRAPVGRLASLPIGESLILPDGRSLEVTEKAKFRPQRLKLVWDAKDTVVQSDDLGSVTVPSLRALLEGPLESDQSADILSQLLAEESEEVEILKGVRRGVITKMGLRDQPILDQYQDEIFRLPLDQRLLILGPPGTGKTTTLIRRLGQKLELQFLDEEEREVVEQANTGSNLPHANSWIMFTPTELLKLYLKEAFNREGVPAPALRIQTWTDYRHELARNVFGILRTSTTNGPFILKDGSHGLDDSCINSPIDWYNDFSNWQKAHYLEKLTEFATFLSDLEEESIASTGERILNKLESNAEKSLYPLFNGLAGEYDKLQAILSNRKDQIDQLIRNALNIQLNLDKTFIDDFSEFLSTLQQDLESEEEDDDELDIEEDVEISPRKSKAYAVSHYGRTVRTKARSIITKRKISSGSRSAQVLDWLGDRIPGNDDLEIIGTSLAVQKNVRPFINPVKRYLSDIPRAYKAFRRLRTKDKQWYTEDKIRALDLNPLELDIVLLAVMKNANGLLANANVARNLDSATWSDLKPMQDLYLNQVLVDEVTDFSPIQVACMGSLANPKLQSFFACGDFNQRLTTWGSHSLDQLKWVFPQIDVKEITITYRQSRLLNEFSREIIRAVGGSDPSMITPQDVENEGVQPVLLEHARESDEIDSWLSARVVEIEQFVGQLPSIAIFVISEDHVQPVTDRLNALLETNNIRVVACPEGRAVGQDGDVRVFDVQHIKGLEFEAVFFIGVDSLATLHPELFDKYLYVGATRAATYLGLTCEDTLPEKIATLRPLFTDNWMGV